MAPAADLPILTDEELDKLPLENRLIYLRGLMQAMERQLDETRAQVRRTGRLVDAGED